jgi:hypothetical protein
MDNKTGINFKAWASAVTLWVVTGKSASVLMKFFFLQINLHVLYLLKDIFSLEVSLSSRIIL